MYFWLIEGFLFFIFFYYYLNSSQEPVYTYDFSATQVTYLFNLSTSYFTFLLLIVLVFILYYTLLNLASFTFTQKLFYITLSSLLLVYIFLQESYQLYYVLNTFCESF